jgi:hypothetical protein
MRRSFLIPLLASSGLALAASPACGSASSTFDRSADDGGGEGGGALEHAFDDASTRPPCTGLACQVEDCAGSPPTTISGTVFAPNGTLPLYNAVVYVPNAPLDPIPEGPSCDHCGNVSGEPIAATLTDTQGKFVLSDVPSGSDIPLVIQIGKWRREIKLPSVPKCTETRADKTLTRLPKNQSEGHIPRIAVTTGLCDHLACLLPKLGLDASEYTASTGSGRLNLYRGATDTEVNKSAPAPAGTPSATELWKDTASLGKYDMVVLSCECNEHDETKPDSAKNALYEYAKAGGRVFASHYHYTWFQKSPHPEVRSLAEWSVGYPDAGAPFGTAPGGLDEPFLVDQSFPKGQALAEWLVNVAATTKKGEIPINQPKQDVVGVDKTRATRWIYNSPGGGGLPDTTKYLSFNAPVDVPADNQCGKVVFGDLHITRPDINPGGGVITTLPDDGFPASCPQELTPEEKALIFLFFDLSSCVQKEEDKPRPPILK